MHINSRIPRASLMPYALAEASLPIRLYLWAHGRRKTIIEKQIARWSMKLFRLLQAADQAVGDRRYARATLAGTTFSFNSLNTQFHSIYQYVDGYELDVMASIRTFLPKDGVFLDVGANWGHFSFAVASDAGFSGRVIAFEPAETTYADFRHILGQLPEAGKRIEVHNVALSNSAGTAFLRKGDVYSGLATVSNDNLQGGAIRLVRLDDLNLGRVDLVKIDVEGHEEAVLQGAAETLRRQAPVIIFESWCSQATMQDDIKPITFLQGLGYRFFMATISLPETQVAINDLKGVATGQFGLSLLEFSPGQRAFFECRRNILAIHRDSPWLGRPTEEQP